MKAIFKKDFLSYFRNVVGWLFLGINLIFYGVQMTAYNLLNSYGNVSAPLSFLIIVFTLLVPILTMRTFAEERKNRTDQLLYTAPVSVWKIVIGKYLALILILGIMAGIISITPFIMHFYGDISYKENYVAILGFFIFGVAVLSIGLFISSLFENVIIAAIITFVILLFGLFSNSIIGNFNTSEGVSNFFKVFDFVSPCDDFLQGILSLKHIVYFASIIFICLFLTVQVISKRRYSISKKTFSMTAFSITGIVIALAAIICGNILINKVPVKYSEIDLTQEKLYKLTKDTKNFLKKYDTDTMIYVYGTKSSVSEIERKTLSEMKEVNKHIKVKYVDPSVSQNFFTKYTSDDLYEGSLVVVNNSNAENSSGAASSTENRFKVVSAEDIFLSTMDYYSGSYSTTGYDGEGQIVSALNYVASEDMPKIYELSGHDEIKISGNFATAIEKLNLEDQDLNLLTSDKIPDDCKLLIIHAPQSDLSMNDISKIKDYIDGGGKVMIDFEFVAAQNLSNLKAMLSEYGITVNDGAVCETDTNYYNNSQFVLLPNVESMEATTDLTGQLQVLSPYSVSFTYDTEDGSGNTYTPILTTSESSFLRPSYINAEDVTSDSAGGDLTMQEGDVQGPFTVGLRETTSDGGQITLYGSAYQFEDSADSIVSGRNQKLFSQTLSSAIPDEVSESVTIPSKSYASSYITVSARLVMIYGLFFSVVIPVFIIIFGIVLWAVRRKY